LLQSNPLICKMALYGLVQSDAVVVACVVARLCDFDFGSPASKAGTRRTIVREASFLIVATPAPQRVH
jgi:hypothetical protein